MRREILAACILLSACRGERSPPLEAGAGLIVESSKVRVDPARVPLLDSCSPGEIVRRSAEGWSCAASALVAESAIAAQLNSLTAEIEQLEADVGMIEDRALRAGSDVGNLRANLEAKVRADETLPYAIGAVACVLSQETVRAGSATSGNGRVFFAAGATGRIVLYCPLIATNSAQRWDAWTLRHLDSDGAAAGGQISATLFSVSPDGTLATISTLTSGASGATGDLRGPLTHTFDFDARYYFVQIDLQRSDASVNVEAIGIRIGG